MSFEVPCLLGQKTEQVTVHHKFNVVDSKGRAIGAQVTTWEGVLIACTPDEAKYALHIGPPGPCYFFQPYATRDSAPYGAIQHAQRFASRAARDVAVVKYLEGARKRALKKQAEA